MWRKVGWRFCDVMTMINFSTIGRVSHWVSDWVSNKDVFRTAWATQGQLISKIFPCRASLKETTPPLKVSKTQTVVPGLVKLYTTSPPIITLLCTVMSGGGHYWYLIHTMPPLFGMEHSFQTIQIIRTKYSLSQSWAIGGTHSYNPSLLSSSLKVFLPLIHKTQF